MDISSFSKVLVLLVGLAAGRQNFASVLPKIGRELLGSFAPQ
jgi:hypothetical protein